ncbi:MAG: hypothetical protein LBL53_01195 [Endomicrobium sp.]|jgi:lipoate-protein ligase A|nr:hypothetical protein [Endomicrobium sp.]
MNLNWIYDISRNINMNMALDEMIFNKYSNFPTLRIYSWKNPCITIGYFQKIHDISMKNLNFTRRLTGGLTVKHYKDISYCFVTSSNFWDIYNYINTYKKIHEAIHNALELIGIQSSFNKKKHNNKNIKNTLCINNICDYDLIFNNKKIVGSCSRRRKNKLMVQGSIHINLDSKKQKHFSIYFVNNLAKILVSKNIRKINFNIDDINYAKKIMYERYSNKNWKNKF